MQSRYYADVASRLLQALSQPAAPKAASIRALRLACEALRVLERDLAQGGDLRWSLDHLNSLLNEESSNPDSPLHRRAQATLFCDGRQVQVSETLIASHQLLEVFLIAETQALRQASIPQDVVAAIQSCARQATNEITQAKLNPDALGTAVSNLAGNVCRQAQLGEEVDTIGRRIKRAAMVLGGGAAIGVNASVDAVTTLGLAPWMTVVSGAVGGTMIGNPFEGW